MVHRMSVRRIYIKIISNWAKCPTCSRDSFIHNHVVTHDKEDCVLFITNNGDQSELRAMVKVVSDYNIPIITISSSEHNHVAQRF